MIVKKVYLVRHGETDYNREHRWQGHLDIPLNETGRKQAQALAGYLRDHRIGACYSSDLKRAYDTASLALKYHKIPIQPEPRLREMALGRFQGKTRQQLQAELPDIYEKWNADDAYAPPEGESRLAMQARSLAAWRDIIANAQHETIMLTTHGGTLRMLLPKIVPKIGVHVPRFPNTSITIVSYIDDDGWQLVSAGQTPHLNEQEG